MSIERDLISKVLLDRDLTPVSEAGVTAEFFQSSEHREVYKFIVEHHRDYSSVPSPEALKRNYPSYKVSEPGDPLQYYVDQICLDFEDMLMQDALVKATDEYEAGDTTGAKRTIAQCLTRVNQTTTRVNAIDLTHNARDRVAKYREYSKSGGALKGISTGFSMIDAATGGMQPGQLFVFVGPPKAGKSTMMLLSAMFANMGFYKPLFIGFEMSNQEQAERHDAIRSGISATRLRDGKLRKEDVQALEAMTKRLELMPEMIFTADSTSSSTLSGVTGLIEKYDPDVVYIDGMYMMDDEFGETKGSPQALTNLTRGFKRMAQNLHIPVAISTQALLWKMDRKRGLTTNSIGYSSSFAQDADVLVGVERTDDDNRNRVKILDGRNVKRMQIDVLWDWDNGTFEEVDINEDEGGVSDEEAAQNF